MGSFTLFQQLPTELQLQVWEHAIANEAITRRIPVDDFAMCIYPDPKLISPLLTTCSGSRQVALSYYCDPIPIHIFQSPELSLDYSRDLDAVFREGVLLIHAIQYDEIGPDTMAQYSRYHRKRQGKRVGVLRVSLACDRFVDGRRRLCKEVMNYYVVNALRSTGRCHFVTPQLNDSQYNQVIRTLNEDLDLDRLQPGMRWQHGVFGPHRVIQRRLLPRPTAAVVGVEGP
ncbi:hypothetical protein PG993_002562 [Apiospora rasikravindrae]|uniref:2EXR domain-containing protein n=1 Tax=Apiospora rasikravindrae TaxID=990691 RepID=A0ABR1TX62_9PEZI